MACIKDNNQHDLLLVGVKGNINFQNSNVPVITTPDDIYTIIKNTCSDKPLIQLFAEKEREGWESWKAPYQVAEELVKDSPTENNS